MTDICILLADNDAIALKIYGEFLTSLGYKVLTAASVEEAGVILDTCRVHFAILDLRLTEDTDEGDRSGLLLAMESDRSVPKLILTNWTSYRDMRDALRTGEKALPPAIDFLSKSETLETFGKAVAQAIELHIRMNRDLVIQQDEAHSVTFPQLALLLAPDADSLQRDAEELEDLFRSLFYDTAEIKLGWLLWQQPGRVALKALIFAEGQPPDGVIVVCGQRGKVEEETLSYGKFAPKVVGHVGTALSKTSATRRYAANSYAIAGTDPENTVTLLDLYRSSPERDFKAAVTHLFENTLAEWQQDAYLPNDGKTMTELYAERLHCDDGLIVPRDLTSQFQSLVRQFPALGVEAGYDAKGLTIRFGGREYTYPDPVPLLKQAGKAVTPASLIKTPGLLSGSNVLTDLEGRTWLTDFYAAGFAPQLWNFATLEAEVRFDWAESRKLQWLHEMEQYLTGDQFTLNDLSEVEPALRKHVRAIRLIRKLGARTINRNYSEYHLAVLLHAVYRLKGFNAGQRLAPRELIRPAHLLLATAMICGGMTLASPKRGAKTKPKSSGVHVDLEKETVTVNGVRVRVRGQSYSLLSYMFEHLGEVCTRRALVERCLAEEYDERDASQIARLNTAMRRLREKVEPNPDRPRYIMMERQGGYWLVSSTAPK